MNNAPGWLTSDRKPRQILIEYSRKVPQDGVVLELGSLFGATTQLLRTYLDPTCNIIVVDSWSDIQKDKLPDSLGDALIEIKNKEVTEVIPGDNVYKWWKLFTKDLENVTHFREDVLKVEKQNLPKVDLIIQDAQHTYEGVLAELKYWWPQLKKGGIIIIDDYNWENYPGLCNAVDEFFSEKSYTTKTETTCFLLIIEK